MGQVSNLGLRVQPIAENIGTVAAEIVSLDGYALLAQFAVIAACSEFVVENFGDGFGEDAPVERVAERPVQVVQLLGHALKVSVALWVFVASGADL